MMKAVRTSETSAYSNETTRRFNPNARISNNLPVFNKHVTRVPTAVSYQINGGCEMMWQPAVSDVCTNIQDGNNATDNPRRTVPCQTSKKGYRESETELEHGPESTFCLRTNSELKALHEVATYIIYFV
jgi:hypothetical protein